MNRIVYTFFAVSLFFSLAAGAQAYEGKIEYDKKKQDAFLIEFPYSTEATNNALVKRMEQLGYKAKEEKGLFNRDKGFKVYKGALLSDISSNRMDYLIYIDKKGKKEKDGSILYLVILKDDGTNAMAGFDAADMQAARNFLAKLTPDVVAADLELQIQSQQDVVSKAEKKLSDLQKDKAELEEKLKKNEKDQDMTQKDIENQRQILESLKMKRVNNM